MTIIHTTTKHILLATACLALLFVLIGWLRHYYFLDDQAAEAVRDYHHVLAMEAQLDRFDQVMAVYGIKPIPVSGEATHD